MSKRAEQKALEAYPAERGHLHDRPFLRDGFIHGYEQAEKDLAPLIEAATIVYEAWNGSTMDDVRRGMVELGKRFKEDEK